MKTKVTHEQLHFDIAEYHRRLFLQKISESNATENMFAATARSIFRDVIEQRKAMNMEYDEQTDIGQNDAEQKKWNEKLSSFILSLDKYKEHTTTVIYK